MSKPEFVTVARLGDIPVGEGRAFEYKNQVVAVFNEGGQYRAIDDMCPHMGASLASGHLEDCIVVCPWHGWSFDTRDGAWCDNRRIKIDVYEVRIVGDEIQVAAVVNESLDENELRDQPDLTVDADRKSDKSPANNSGSVDSLEQEND